MFELVLLGAFFERHIGPSFNREVWDAFLHQTKLFQTSLYLDLEYKKSSSNHFWGGITPPEKEV